MSAIKISAQDLHNNACFYGQKSKNWHPKMAPYLFGKSQGIHIFDLNIMSEKLAELLNRVSELASKGKSILFVSTKTQTRDILSQIKEETGMPVVSHKWFGGLLTNFETMKGRIAWMKKLREEFETGSISRYTKKEQSKYRKELDKLETALSGVEDMTKTPDAIFVVDGFRDDIAVQEAKKLGAEVLGIADSNVNPDNYSYFVPANDDSMQSISFILGHVVTAFLTGKGSK